jgi:rhodanese-related sulfurtransferase
MLTIMLKHISRLFLVAGFGLGFLTTVYALSPVALEQELDGGQKITIIDIRPNAMYQKNHIQNAINIPASIIERKRLPPLGRVVVYGEGIDIVILEQAVSSLNAKPGIQAEALEGGFSAWSARNRTIQRETGITTSQVKNLTYQELRKMTDRNDVLLLVDLRMGMQQELLAEHFPRTRVYDPIDTTQDDVTNMKVSSYILQTLPKNNRKVLILIDDGNGFAEKVADKLHAAGTKRLAILAGGEQALRVRGEISEDVRNSGG